MVRPMRPDANTQNARKREAERERARDEIVHVDVGGGDERQHVNESQSSFGHWRSRFHKGVCVSVYVCVSAESGSGVRTRTSHFPALILELPPSLADQFGGGYNPYITQHTGSQKF